jgi:hypothetical protein
MSTKIYEAYNIPLARLGEWQEFFHKACKKHIIKVLRDNKGEVSKDISEEFRKRSSGGKSYSEDDISICLMLARWVKESKRGFNSALNFDSSFNFWIREGDVYIIPYWPCGMKPNVPNWSKDYSYWDNSDYPGNISYEKWEERGYIWNKIALKNWDKGRMSHVAFEGKSTDRHNDYVGLWELINEISKDERNDKIYCGIYEFIRMMEEQGVK